MAFVKHRLLWTAFYAFFLIAPQSSSAGLQCSEIFVAPAYKVLAAEILDYNQIWTNHQNEISAGVAISWYTRHLQQLVSSAKSAGELEAIFLEIHKLGDLNIHYQDALRQVDFLSIFRNRSPKDFPYDELAHLNDTLEALMLNVISGWGPTMEAFAIWENPHHARAVVQDAIHLRTFLIEDFLYFGDHINMTLVNSLAYAPKETRAELLEVIQNALQPVDTLLKNNTYTHSEQVEIKSPTREWQLLQQILIRKELLESVSKLPSVVEARDMHEMESSLLKLHRHQQPYGFETVFAVAKAMQKNMNSILSDTDFVDIFGSFPNLSAHKSTSDIDLIFSRRLDQAYFELLLNQTGDAVRFAKAISSAEQAAMDILNIQRAQGNLFSVTLQARTEADGNMVLQQGLAQTELWYTMSSPVIIRIFRDRIYLRVADSLSTQRNNPALVYEFLLAQ